MNGQDPPVFGRDIQKQMVQDSVLYLQCQFSQPLGLLYRWYPSNPPNLPIRERVSETIIPGFKVIVAEGLRQGQSWKWNTGIFESLAKALTI